MSCGAAPRRCGLEKTALWLAWVGADDDGAAVDAAGLSAQSLLMSVAWRASTGTVDWCRQPSSLGFDEPVQPHPTFCREHTFVFAVDTAAEGKGWLEGLVVPKPVSV